MLNGRSSLSWSLVFSIYFLTLPAAGASDLTGDYQCSVPGRAQVENLHLFPDNRWIKGSPLDPSTFKLSWIRVKNKWFSGVMPQLERDPSLRGKFEVVDDRVILFTLHPGPKMGAKTWSKWDKYSIPLQIEGEELVPDALLAFEQSFQFEPSSRTLVEILPANSTRQPVTCGKERPLRGSL